MKTELRYNDLSKTAKMKVESNFKAAKTVLKDYDIKKTVIKVTAIFERKGERISHEMSFNKSGMMLSDNVIERRFI